MPKPKQAPLIIGGQSVGPGERRTIELPIAYLYTHHDVTMPVHVIRGQQEGPVLFVSGALHGDEINGVEIIARLLRQKAIDRLHGTLLALPVVNVYGFLHHSRYLPDRRDLNRSFPGSQHGSMAARLADMFVTEILAHSTHGIDLHTAAYHRTNLPQIRAHLADAETERLAHAFGVPVILDSPVIEGSLRETAQQRQIPLLVYECGESLRFDEMAIQAGVKGILAVMRAIGMLPERRQLPRHQSRVTSSSQWVRAPVGGVLRSRIRLGQWIEKGMLLGHIGDPMGMNMTAIEARSAGLVIGMNLLPLVDEGNALFHIASFEADGVVELIELIEQFQKSASPEQEPQGS
ncbi:MAG: succinylglutamate desuccinylase/aspartoacylase family protein [Candidatus Sericytochromatia bacterium]